MRGLTMAGRKLKMQAEAEEPPSPVGPLLGGPKKPFEIDRMLAGVAAAVDTLPRAAMFELAEQGYDSLFEVLVACIISIRTRDEATVPIAQRLFVEARTPTTMAALTPKRIDELIRPCTFHGAKAHQLHEIARQCVKFHHGEVPCEVGVLTSFRGVGPKCANLALGIACPESEQIGIGVDVHVHRVTNRWGYVKAPTPEKTMRALQESLPRRHWVRINALLVPFGKHICTGTRPKCSVCPVRDYCRQVGVVNPR